VSVHTTVPVSHASVPLWQGLVGVQAEPATHGMQVPSMHTLPVPQDVPLGLFPETRQVETPVEHEVVPTLQRSVTWQALTAQATQTPALQTLSVPQEDPFARSSPLSEQLMAGEQTALPLWHGLAGVQESPTAQATHAPPLQTLPKPHIVPSGAFPDSKHTGAPVLQTVEPTRQGAPGMAQTDPATHATHEPAAPQTRSFPQAVPEGRLIPVSVHWAAPPVQVSAPLWQGFAALQASPPTQSLHMPA